MAGCGRCGGNGAVCTCAVSAGTNVTVVGNGSTGSPYVISAAGTIPQTLNNQVGTTYTIVNGDAGKRITFNNASPVALSVPGTLTVAIGTRIDLVQLGAGQVTVAGTAGATVNSTPGLKLRAQFSGATLVLYAANTWLLVGDTSV